MITCDTVKVTVENADGMLAELIIPAYTREDSEFITVLDTTIDEYISRSRTEAGGVSLGDFALFLLGRASKDPREQAEEQSD